jgi:hypothetical protein
VLRAVKIITTFASKMVIFPARDTNIYKICELHRAIFSSFYNNSQPIFAILLILRMLFLAVVMDFVLLVQIKISSQAGIIHSYRGDFKL